MSSSQTTEHDKAQEDSMPCPACIEAATVEKGEHEFVPEHALTKYTFEQLGDHLNSNRHTRKELIVVALRAAAFLYCHAIERIEGV